MNILCIGGGPAGLYFALLMKQQQPAHRVTVIERNRPDDTFGWGVVFSDQTLGNLHAADPDSALAIQSAFNHWDNIDVHFKGRTITSGGHGFCGIGRQRLLTLLQTRARDLGVELVFETEVTDEIALIKQYDADLVIAADGLNSRIRNQYATTFQPDIDRRHCRFVWLGTHQRFDAFTFAFEETPHGWFQAHAYQYDGNTSTFIVETPEAVWHRAGLAEMTQAEAIDYCQRLFARYLGGHTLMSNARHLRGSAMWINFPRVICKTWVHRLAVGSKTVPLVLMGDAAHTAHFSIGSGTKLALEDAIELARCFDRHGEKADVAAVLADYQRVRSVEVLKIQNAARNSTEWFENVSRYTGMEAEQFAYTLLTRSQRISHENLRLRDRAYIENYECWFAAHTSAVSPTPAVAALPPMFTPYTLRGLTLKNRVVVSPMAMYSAQDGVPGEFHLVHLGARALGGAGLIFAEMTCPSADARITPGCPGLWNDAQQAAWARIVDFVHRESDARIALQLGHAGPKGSTQRGWEEADRPLTEGNWPLMAASAIPWSAHNTTPRAMTEEDMARVTADFVAAAQRAAEAGFDWLELHGAHGYLLSSFICPLTNRREDQYGGSLENRCRFPLAVFRALRAVWPKDRPMSVRISAHDWAPGGNTADDAVAIARLFKAAGCDLIDVSSGQTTEAARPIYGRMYQTPFADRIRNEVGIATMAVGAIFEADHVNSIIAAGRADLCAVARPHLADAAWTLHQAARLRVSDISWPKQYLSGKAQLERNLERERAQAASQAGLSTQEIAAKLLEG
ncbi:MAG: bifunctional salicylyl-CoA 5-hydroxylase/oxidoreductase [Betaproteobacteria bacterium]|nr:bifunctional salicylyl-CoA 5-hydroxylase/oxidoreductase [Betaproteobacteria bacterium]